MLCLNGWIIYVSCTLFNTLNREEELPLSYMKVNSQENIRCFVNYIAFRIKHFKTNFLLNNIQYLSSYHFAVKIALRMHMNVCWFWRSMLISSCRQDLSTVRHSPVVPWYGTGQLASENFKLSSFPMNKKSFDSSQYVFSIFGGMRKALGYISQIFSFP